MRAAFLLGILFCGALAGAAELPIGKFVPAEGKGWGFRSLQTTPWAEGVLLTATVQPHYGEDWQTPSGMVEAQPGGWWVANLQYSMRYGSGTVCPYPMKLWLFPKDGNLYVYVDWAQYRQSITPGICPTDHTFERHYFIEPWKSAR